jgi:hypothetical protein
MEGTAGGATSAGAEALRRELYWAPPPERAATARRYHGAPISPLASRWRSLAGALRWEYTELFPPEPLLRVGRGPRLRMKRLVWRYTRPISRRYDRIAGDLAELGFETAQALGDEIGADLAALASTRGATTFDADVPAAPAQPSIKERLAQLEDEVAELRRALERGRGADGEPGER